MIGRTTLAGFLVGLAVVDELDPSSHRDAADRLGDVVDRPGGASARLVT